MLLNFRDQMGTGVSALTSSFREVFDICLIPSQHTVNLKKRKVYECKLSFETFFGAVGGELGSKMDSAHLSIIIVHILKLIFMVFKAI